MKRAIVLESAPNVRIALWAIVPQQRRPFYAKEGAVSAWPGASQEENEAIALGTVAEKVIEVAQEPLLDDAAKRALIEEFAAAWQGEINERNPWKHYGTFFDDPDGWTENGLA